MLGTSITLTVNGNAKVLPQIKEQDFSGEYYLQEATEDWRLKVSHTKQAANKLTGVVYNRHVIDFTQTTYAVPGVSPEVQKRVYTTFVLKDGDVPTTVYLGAALSVYLAASTNAAMTKILGWES
jgi:hypothetical protein